MISVEERAAREYVARAKGMLGAGWLHVSEEVRWGLVCAQIIADQRAQDESIAPARVLARTAAITEHAFGMVFGIAAKRED
jgi:hypothetical protein